ncbi:MAG: haloacid dehalogenase [Chloroflexota bacterium]
MCANSIRAVHRGEIAQADALIEQARSVARGITDDLRDHPDLYHAGYVQDALKELVEAIATHGLVTGQGLPAPSALGIPVPAFLNGLAECVGELRRWVLDQLRQGDLSRCESILQTMDDIYGLLVTIDYPDALTGGLRRTTDLARGILERTRGDLTFALRQQHLEAALARVESDLQT